MVLFVMLMACSGTKVTDDTGAVGDDTGGADDTGEGGETGESGESGETGAPGPDVIFQVDGSYTDAVLSLRLLDAEALGAGSVVLWDELAAVTATEVTGLTLGEPPEDQLIEIDPSNAPGMMGAFYVPGLYTDLDGDAAHDDDEPWVGMGLNWPLYLTGTIPRELLEQGFQAGWNAVRFSAEDEAPDLLDPLAIPIDTNMLPNESLTLGGTWSASVGPEGYGVFLAPYPLFEGESVDDWLYDGPAEGSVSIELVGEPPEDHFAVLDFLGGPGALEVPIAYSDVDGDGAFNAGDLPAFAACQDDFPVGALWLPPVTDESMALTLAMQGVGTGWIAVALADSVGLPDADRLDELVLSEDCALE